MLNCIIELHFQFSLYDIKVRFKRWIQPEIIRKKCQIEIALIHLRDEIFHS